IALDFLLPYGFGRGWGWLGLVLFTGAVAFAKWAIGTMKKAGTNVPPNLPATALVTHGPFQYSRNPIYLAFLVAYAGLGMMADAPIMMVLVIGLFFALERGAIRPEEDYLTQTFGEDYLTFKARTRRWV
ncbi:MAG: methyltransferase family protein, partial [Bdellovibrionales bacterium]